jgi:hypothetical protein
MEKLTLEDAHVAELMVNKINEIIDVVNDLEERLSSRIDNHWAYHRHIKMTMDGVKTRVIPKEGVPNEQQAANGSGKDVPDKEVPKV